MTFAPDGTASRSYDASWEATTGTAGVQWDPNPDTMVYARYSRGYKQGGFASGVTSSLGKFPYTNAEHVDDFELGLKKDFGSRFQVNVDVFYEDLKGYQIPLTVVNLTGGLAVSESRYLNVPKSEIKGVEIEGTWIPIDNLTLLFTYDYNDGKITELSGIIDGTDPQAVAPGAKPLTALLLSSGNPLAPGGDPALRRVNTGYVQRAAGPERQPAASVSEDQDRDQCDLQLGLREGLAVTVGRLHLARQAVLQHLHALAMTPRRLGISGTPASPGRTRTTSSRSSPTSRTSATPWATTAARAAPGTPAPTPSRRSRPPA